MSKLISRKPLILRFREAVLMSLLLLSSISLNAAGGPRISVSGTVTSESDGEPLIGVSILIKGTNDGVATDVDGRYTLHASKGDVLVFSSIGYLTTEVKVENNVIDVAMKDDVLKLDDVVVIGYGTMKRSDITGSVVSVGADDIKKNSDYLGRSGSSGSCGRCAGHSELRLSRRRYLGLYPRYKLSQRQ